MAARKTLSNAADVRVLGCKSEAGLPGKTDFDFFPKAVAKKLFADDRVVLKTRKPMANREEKVVRPDGEKSRRRVVANHAKPLSFLHSAPGSDWLNKHGYDRPG